MKATELLKSKFPDIKIPKRRSKKVQGKILRNSLKKRGQSIIHEEILKCLPKPGRGIWWKVPKASPGSFQTTTGKRMQKLVIRELQSDANTKRVCEKIDDKPLQILILYKLVNIRRKRDIDNYTKNIIDSLRKGGLFKDDNNHQVRFIASKVDYLDVDDKSYYSAYEKFIVFLDYFDEKHPIIKDFNLIFGGRE